MDKNTIIGFILIILILVGFSYLNRPSKEQMEAQRQYRDSITNLRQLQKEEQQAIFKQQDTDKVEKNEQESDSLFLTRIAAKYGDFAGAAQGEEDFITLENDLLILKITTKGGRIHSAQLKNYTDYKDNPLVLFQGNEANF